MARMNNEPEQSALTWSDEELLAFVGAQGATTHFKRTILAAGSDRRSAGPASARISPKSESCSLTDQQRALKSGNNGNCKFVKDIHEFTHRIALIRFFRSVGSSISYED